MKYLIQFSGGVGSFAAACWAVNEYGRDSVELLFADTMMEDEDLYRFVDDCVNYLQVPLHVVKDGRNPWEVFKAVKFLGNSRVDPCSRILKRELCKHWVKQNYPDISSVKIVLGIDWTEGHRVKNFERWWNPYTGIAPLVDSTFDKNGFMQKMEKEWGIKIPRLYTLGFPHNNCGGFCVKAGKAHFLHLLEVLPERYQYHEERERELQQYLGKPYTILREQVGKEKRYISLSELRERKEAEANTESGKLDWGGCGCFSDIDADEFDRQL